MSLTASSLNKDQCLAVLCVHVLQPFLFSSNNQAKEFKMFMVGGGFPKALTSSTSLKCVRDSIYMSNLLRVAPAFGFFIPYTLILNLSIK